MATAIVTFDASMAFGEADYKSLASLDLFTQRAEAFGQVREGPANWIGAGVIDPTKVCRIAQDEIEAGKIGYIKKDIPVIKPPVDESGLPIMA